MALRPTNFVDQERNELKSQLIAANQQATIDREDHEKVIWFYDLLFILFMFCQAMDRLKLQLAAANQWATAAWHHEEVYCSIFFSV
jgi:hypothetical protein